MKEPARWREPLGGADPETRALLLEDRPPVPSAVEVKSMWSSLAAQLPPLPILPPAPLAQEREALTIEAMAEKPDLRAAATERALLFLRAYPNSPYRARARSLTLERK